MIVESAHCQGSQLSEKFQFQEIDMKKGVYTQRLKNVDKGFFRNIHRYPSDHNTINPSRGLLYSAAEFLAL